MKKGFTLIELMGTIIIIAACALIIIPVVDKELKEGKSKIKDKEIESIKSALDLYMTDIKLDNNDSMTITLYQLKQKGLIDINIKNPLKDELYPNDMLIEIKNDNGIIKYDIKEETGTNTNNYETLPKLTLNGEVLEYVELNDEYTDTIATSTYNDTKIDYDISSNVDVNTPGVYTITYTSNYNNLSTKILKTVIVRDTKGPILEFTTLNIPLSSVNTYDFKSDIRAYDPSGIKNIEVETNFRALKGTYSIKYIATDNYDNKTIKYRKVITS